MHVLLTGDRNAGKTTVVETVVSRLQARGLDVAGFYTVGGETLELVAARTGERTVFASESETFDEGPTVGRYGIDPGAVERGIALARQDGDVLVLDEIGRLEQRGEGFAPILSELQADRYRGVLVSVRQGVEEFVAKAFSDGSQPVHLEVTESNRDDLPEVVLDRLLGSSR
ncbi:MAG: nucleoside-triphosphatase [Halovenus sp.]